jgi:hypothetical protein
MVNPEIRHHRIEAAIGMGQRRGVALVELQLRMRLPRLHQHRRREIQPAGPGAAHCRRRGNEPGAAADIQHLRPGSDAGRIEQRLDEGCGVREGRVVLRRRLLPAGMLEGADGLGIDPCHVAGYIDQLGTRTAGP